MTKIQTTFRISRPMLDALDELSHPSRALQLVGQEDSRTGWIESILGDFFRGAVKGRISVQQYGSVQDPDTFARLFVMIARAERGEPGYGFSHRDPTKRFVYGPAEDA